MLMHVRTLSQTNDNFGNFGEKIKLFYDIFLLSFDSWW